MSLAKMLLLHLKAEEGLRLQSYLDTVGVWTIGYGTTRWPSGGKIHEGDTITEPWASELLKMHAYTALVDSADYVGGIYSQLSDQRRLVLASMAYQLGLSRLAGFKLLRQALRAFDFARAQEEMLDSRWATEQTPARAKRLALAMVTNDWPGGFNV